MTRRTLLLIAAACCVLQLAGLYRPGGYGGGGPEIPGLDKAAHVAMFALPVLFLLLAGLRRWWVVAVFALHAPVSEVIQHLWLPRRSGDGYDLVADAAGIALGVVAAALVTARKQRSAAGTDQVTTADRDGTPRSVEDQNASSGRSISSRSTP